MKNRQSTTGNVPDDEMQTVLGTDSSEEDVRESYSSFNMGLQPNSRSGSELIPKSRVVSGPLSN